MAAVLPVSLSFPPSTSLISAFNQPIYPTFPPYGPLLSLLCSSLLLPSPPALSSVSICFCLPPPFSPCHCCLLPLLSRSNCITAPVSRLQILTRPSDEHFCPLLSRSGDSGSVIWSSIASPEWTEPGVRVCRSRWRGHRHEIPSISTARTGQTQPEVVGMIT